LDWRNNGGDYTTPAKNQGNCGSCFAFSAMGALEAMINIANSNPNLDLDLSEQYILSCVGPQGLCPNDCVSGGNAYYAFWYIKDGVSPSNNGALPESCFTYQAVDSNGLIFTVGHIHLCFVQLNVQVGRVSLFKPLLVMGILINLLD
jgi:C1A family cysteine protease